MGQLGCKIWNFRWEFLLYSGLGFALKVMQDDEADEMMYLSCIYHLSKLFGVSLPVFLSFLKDNWSTGGADTGMDDLFGFGEPEPGAGLASECSCAPNWFALLLAGRGGNLVESSRNQRN